MKKRVSSLVAVPLAAMALLSASIIAAPVPEAAAQATPAAKPTMISTTGISISSRSA